MSYTLDKAVNFGPGKADLATVGYTLRLSADNSVLVARTTAGVVQVQSGTGIYAAPVPFISGVRQRLVWDTGEATPVYLVEAINPGDDEYTDAAISSRVSAAQWAAAAIPTGSWPGLGQVLSPVGRGTHVVITFSAGTPTNVTGWAFGFYVRHEYGNPVLALGKDTVALGGLVVTDALNGVLQVTLNRSDTLQDPWNWFFSLERIDAGSEALLASGTLPIVASARA